MIKLEIGNRAPDFTLQSNTGENISLSQFLGKKKVVLFFYPMDESPVCSKEAEAFKNKYETFKELGAEVLGISSQSVESHKSFSKHHNLPYSLLSDLDNGVRRRYGVSLTIGIVPKRVTFVIDKEDIIKCIFSSQLQPAKHAEQALLALKSKN